MLFSACDTSLTSILAPPITTAIKTISELTTKLATATTAEKTAEVTEEITTALTELSTQIQTTELPTTAGRSHLPPETYSQFQLNHFNMKMIKT